MQAATEPPQLFDLGNALLQQGRRVAAAEHFLACVQTAPGFGPAYVNLAATLHQLGLLEQAQEMAECGVQRMTHSLAAQLCLAGVLHDRADYAAAATLYRAVLRRAPEHAGALSSLGNTLHDSGRRAEAMALHDRAVAAAPDDPLFRFNRGVARLAAGDFAGGWEDYEWRLRRPERHGGPRPGAAWNGEDLAGRTILLHAEQGLGDTLQFVRYAPMLGARAGQVVLQVPAPLVRLLQRLPGVAQVLADTEAAPPCDTHCPLPSLPRAFATRLETVPGQVPYLHADPALAASWAARLPPHGGRRVGLVWAGSPHPEDVGAQLIDRRRSLPLRALAPLAAIPGVQWVSLQRDRPAASDDTVPELVDPMPHVADFADTAAIVANLDLVIAVDTSVAHLAAGMGCPVWLLSRFDGCWRWLHDRDDSPWYPTMHIYRQERPHNWSGVAARLRADLEAAATGAQPWPTGPG